MKFSPDRLDVQVEVGSEFRYFVSSSNAAEPPYLVDLEARFPMGRCTCKDYECKKWPEFEKTLRVIRCKHCDGALEFHALRHIRTYSKQLNSDGE